MRKLHIKTENQIEAATMSATHGNLINVIFTVVLYLHDYGQIC